MDKKFLGLVALMLAVCLFIIQGAGISSGAAEAIPSAGSDAAYVNSIFTRDEVIDVYVTLAPADFEDMMLNPHREEYKPADVMVNGLKTQNVGFRVKGNSSLRSVASSKSDRYSFKLDIDGLIEGQSLAGLTKLNLNNSFSDPSYMREYLSYSLLKEMGIPTPANCYANVYINGELWGLYLAVEGIEEPFLERYYGSNYGSLYKSVGGLGSDLLYSGDQIKSYSGLVQKTDPKNGADEALLAMIKALNEGRDLDKYLNVDQILRYFAVNTVLVNMDSYVGNFKHNYYLYEKNGVFTILPWDYNMSFGGFGMGGSRQDSTSLFIDNPVSGTTLNQRPLLGRLLEVPEYKELYHKYLEEIITGPFAEDKMQAEVERIAALIRPHLEKDPTTFYTMEQFEQGIGEGGGQQPARVEQGQVPIQQIQPGEVRDEMRGQQPGGGMMQGPTTGLQKFVRERIANVAQQLSGQLPTTGSMRDTPGGNMPGGNMPGGQFGNQPNRQLQPGGQRQRPPEMGMPPGPRQDIAMGARPGGGINATAMSSQQMYLIMGSVGLLVTALLIVLKKKNKYSI